MVTKIKITGALANPKKFFENIEGNKNKFLKDVAKNAEYNLKDEIDKLDVVDAGLKKRAKQSIRSKVNRDKVEVTLEQYATFSEGEIKDIENSLTHRELKKQSGKPIQISKLKGKLFKWAPKDAYAQMKGNKYFLSHHLGNYISRAMDKTKQFIDKNSGRIIE